MDGDNDNNAENEVEQGSSEESLECVSNVSMTAFSGITSCRLVKQKLMENRIDGIVQLPNGLAVAVCQGSQLMGMTSGIYFLKILDKEFNTKVDIAMRRDYQKEQVSVSFIRVALFDRKRIVVLISGFMQDTDGWQHHVSTIHLVSVFQNVEICSEIKLKYSCEQMACSNFKIYCYTPDLFRSTFITCPGVEILSMNGEILKTIQLFDTVSCFCPTANKGIVYFGNRQVDGCNQDIFRCVTDENIDVFSHSAEKPIFAMCAEKPISAISDIKGNLIVHYSSGNIVLLNPDGSQNRVLLDTKSIGSARPTAICFSYDFKRLLVACDTQQTFTLYTYILQYHKQS